MEFKTLLTKRKSVRKFMLGKPVDWRNIMRALDSTRYIPAAGNQYNLRFVIVQDADIITQISEACQQDFIRDAQYVVVCVSDEATLEKTYGERARRYTAQMAGAAIQNLLLALTEEGLATTWVGFFYDEMIKGLLNIPEDHTIEALFPISLEAKNNTTKVQPKPRLENIIYFDSWGNREMTPIPRAHP